MSNVDSNQFNVSLIKFNGPLDVLLYLAKSQKVNLEDIQSNLDRIQSNPEES